MFFRAAELGLDEAISALLLLNLESQLTNMILACSMGSQSMEISSLDDPSKQEGAAPVSKPPSYA
jgi:hypothetical protein